MFNLSQLAALKFTRKPGVRHSKIMNSITFQLLSVSLLVSNPALGYQPYPFDPYDEGYVSALRERFDSFHERLSQGIAPGDNYATDTQWNFDGSLVIGDKEWVKALEAVTGPNGVSVTLTFPITTSLSMATSVARRSIFRVIRQASSWDCHFNLMPASTFMERSCGCSTRI